ncbi:MAG: D-glycerate dehydrogenase [Sedimentibacter sp.]|uniref:2-hydroxyacid dehydrogenase n=1 Tax=Sedimentibacter sp. TaxID=1960295 RepID=UPI00315803EC
MNRPKVYIAKKIPSFVEEYIGKHCDYEMYDNEGRISEETLYEKIKDTEGLLQSGIAIDQKLLDRAPKLKVVSNVSVGYNNFDTDAMKQRNVIGTNTPEVLNDTVADLIFALMLSCARKVSYLDRCVKEGRWNMMDDKSFFGKDVHHATLGIVGMGRIGQDVARRAICGFDMNVLYFNRTRKTEAEEKLGVRYADMETVLSSSDFVLVMTPLSSDTYHLIDEPQFRLMKSDAIFINASRGATVNEKALIKALQEGWILGAGLDVYEQEPVDRENPLLKLDNAVLLPHIGSATEKTRNDMAMLAAENMVKALTGQVPPNIVPELRK